MQSNFPGHPLQDFDVLSPITVANVSATDPNRRSSLGTNGASGPQN